MTGCGTTDMERTHGQLGTRLTDGLCSNNTYRLTHIDNVTTGQVTTVTLGTDTARLWQVSTERILTFSRPESSIRLTKVLIDLLIGLHQHLTGNRIKNIIQSNTTQEYGHRYAR